METGELKSCALLTEVEIDEQDKVSFIARLLANLWHFSLPTCTTETLISSYNVMMILKLLID